MQEIPEISNPFRRDILDIKYPLPDSGCLSIPHPSRQPLHPVPPTRDSNRFRRYVDTRGGISRLHKAFRRDILDIKYPGVTRPGLLPRTISSTLSPVSSFRIISRALLVALALTPAFAQSPADLPDAPGAAAAAAVPTGPTFLFDTSMGRLTCKTFDKQAPLAVANFIGLAEGTRDWTLAGAKQHGKRFYDGLTFHRVIPGFMIQGGDPVGNGSGDAGYYFADEIDPTLTFSVPGRLAMANSGPNTNSSQFFITEGPVAELDGHYTIFGQCDAHSVALVASIARLERDARDKPLTPVVIQHVTIVRDGQPIPPEPSVPAPAPSAATPVSLGHPSGGPQ
jgi:peptidyl-prolyl cis-trans isomerase A (cyclophilin A)